MWLNLQEAKNRKCKSCLNDEEICQSGRCIIRERGGRRRGKTGEGVEGEKERRKEGEKGKRERKGRGRERLEGEKG